MQTTVQILNVVFIFSVSWWIWKQDSTKMCKFFWPALAAKLSAGILLGVIFASVYTTSDTFWFFDSAIEQAQKARIDFSSYIDFLLQRHANNYSGENRSIFFIKIASMFSLLTFDNYWICSIYFSWFSFLAAWSLTKFIWVKIPNAGIAAAAAFLFFPSSVFWASGIMKESLTMVGIFYLARLFLQIWMKEKISWFHLPFVLLTLWVAWTLKYYYVGLFAPAVFATIATRWLLERYRIHGPMKELTCWFLIFMMLLATATFLHPNFSLNRIAAVIAENHDAIIAQSNPDDVIHFSNLNASWSSLIVNGPLALVSGLFRPFLWEANTVFKLAVSIENLVILVLLIHAIRALPKLMKSPFHLPIIALIVYSILLCLFLALSSPNFGTLVRLRIGFLPFLLLIIVNQPVVIRPLSKLFNVPMDVLKG